MIGRRMHGISAHAPLDDLDLVARLQWVGKGTNSLLKISTTMQATRIRLATTVGLLLFYVTLTLKTLIWLDHLFILFFKSP